MGSRMLERKNNVLITEEHLSRFGYQVQRGGEMIREDHYFNKTLNYGPVRACPLMTMGALEVSFIGASRTEEHGGRISQHAAF